MESHLRAASAGEYVFADNLIFGAQRTRFANIPRPQHPVLLEAGVTGKAVASKSRECGPGMDPNLGFKILRQPPQADGSSPAAGAAELSSFTRTARRGKKMRRNHSQV